MYSFKSRSKDPPHLTVKTTGPLEPVGVGEDAVKAGAEAVRVLAAVRAILRPSVVSAIVEEVTLR